MATNVTIQVGGSAKVCDYEVSGAGEGVLSGRESKSVSIGAHGSVVNLLTLRRVGPGSIKVKASGTVYVSLDGGKDKKTKSFSFGPKNTRASVREQPHH